MTYSDLTGSLKTLFDFHYNDGKIKITDGEYTLEEILNKDYDWWENNHDFIQWVFPTNKKSNFNDNSPVVTEDYVKLHPLTIPELGIKKFNKFYDFISANKLLLGNFNHNFLRFSRLLEHIALFYGKTIAQNEFLLYHSTGQLKLTKGNLKSFSIWLNILEGN